MNDSCHGGTEDGFVRLAFALALLWLSCSSLLAEPAAGSIAGKVLDPQGAAVSGAHLSLLNAAGTVVRDFISDAQGNFTLDAVSPGYYQISADAASYASVITNVGVSGGQQQAVAVQFQQIASAVQALTIVASHRRYSRPIPRKASSSTTKFLTPTPAVPAHRFPFQGSPSRPPLEASRHHNTSLPESRETTASP